jgi:hypothetical protein
MEIIFLINRTYEDIIQMNENSSKNASASIDDEHKFQVVCHIFLIKSNKREINLSFKISLMQYSLALIKLCRQDR